MQRISVEVRLAMIRLSSCIESSWLINRFVTFTPFVILRTLLGIFIITLLSISPRLHQCDDQLCFFFFFPHNIVIQVSLYGIQAFWRCTRMKRRHQHETHFAQHDYGFRINLVRHLACPASANNQSDATNIWREYTRPQIYCARQQIIKFASLHRSLPFTNCAPIAPRCTSRTSRGCIQ